MEAPRGTATSLREVTVLRTGQMTDSLPVTTVGVTGLSYPTDAVVAATV
jgi:hypothetical protein